MKKKNEQTFMSAEPMAEAPESETPKRAVRRKKVVTPEVSAEAPPMRPARKPAKSKGMKALKPGPKKTVGAKVEKPARRKPGPKKEAAERPKKAAATKVRKKPARKPGRKPGVKAAIKVPAVRGKKLSGREADLVKKGQEAFVFFLDQQRQMDEMAQMIANYERVFEAVRVLFSREMEELEELVGGLLE